DAVDDRNVLRDVRAQPKALLLRHRRCALTLGAGFARSTVGARFARLLGRFGHVGRRLDPLVALPALAGEADAALAVGLASVAPGLADRDDVAAERSLVGV